MKKITLLAVAALAISFASCKKDRTCTCTGTTGTSTTQTYTKVKKGPAKDACQKTSGTHTSTNAAGTTSTAYVNDCKLS